MTTKSKTQIMSHDDTVMSPITKASNVLFEDGETAQDKLEDNVEKSFTPSVENSSSMFKVGQGDNVDYSGNVVDGAYVSCVLKGKTMVNCIQESSSQDVILPYEFTEGQYVTINETKESGALGVELKGRTLVNLVDKIQHAWGGTGLTLTRDSGYTELSVTETALWYQTSVKHTGLIKLSTTYLAILEVVENTLATPFTLTGNANDGKFLMVNNIVRAGQTGIFKIKLNSKPTFDTSGANRFDLFMQFGKNESVGNKIKLRLMLIEYQQDMENWDIPYFEGMTSCKMPILSTVGKNLFDGGIKNGSNLHINTGIEESGTRTISLNFTKVKPNTTYTFSRPLALGAIGLRFYDKDKNYIKHGSTSATTSITFTTPNQCYYIKWVDEANKTTEGYQIEEGSTGTTYEPHKTSILSLPEEVVLGGLGNTRDTFNTTTGKYTKRTDTMTVTNYKNSLGSSVVEGAWSIVVAPPNKKWQTTTLCVSDKFSMGGGHSNRDCGFYENPANFVFFDKTVNSADEFIAKYGDFSFTYILKTPVVTKINLSSTLKSWNTTTHIYSEIPENSLYPILSHSNPTYPVILKPLTKYSVVANSYSNNHTNSPINFNLGGATASTTVGNRVTTVTTPSTLSNELLTMSGKGNKLNNVMVIEGDVVGDEPYFEGICDVKSPVVKNVGKNLFDYNLLDKQSYTKNGLTFVVIGDTLTIKGTATSGGYMSLFDYTLFDTWGSGVYANTDKYIELGEGTYCISTHGKITKPEVRLANAFGQGTKLIGHIYPKDKTTFTIQNNERFGLCLVFGFSNGATYDEEIKIQLEKTSSNTFTTYEPHKSNTTTFNQKDGKIIVLRSLPNGICDTLNVETGEYVRRIGEKTLNGEENGWYAWVGVENDSYKAFALGGWVTDSKEGNHTVIGNKLSNQFIEAPSTSQKGEWFMTYRGMNAIWIAFNIAKSKLVDTTVASFISYLKQKTITVQYELATPIISTIDVQGFPYAYKDGHVQLSSGYNGQSLTPKIEYSLPINRNCQIRMNQAMVERHQKHIDKLQAMIITNMVNTQYRQSLTKINYQLGGE